MPECPHCGTDVGGPARYCPNCGERLEEGELTAERSADEAWGETDDPRGEDAEWGERPERASGRGRSSGHRGFDPASRNDEQGDTTIAALAHVSGLFLWIPGPLIFLVIADDEFAERNARNALNWQIAFGLYAFVSLLLALVVVGFFLFAALVMLDLAFCVIAAVKASEGETWEYPITPAFF